ncbi:hypothetical protein LST1_06440 [Neisseria elongata]|uniref:hypothetical protein n=1 Tax=Neisseria elongata TaxID=495 RepID=UPI002852DE67|nr:hypothetical protein LST1_06440 [Neisseria elongata]
MNIQSSDWNIELWIDNGRLMLSDPEREQENIPQPFRLPVNGGSLIFEHIATIKGRRIFQATALCRESDPQHSQAALWTDAIGLRQEAA